MEEQSGDETMGDQTRVNDADEELQSETFSMVVL